ncbi:phosphogluconate dehydrogenase (NAD(+)-dependent, decarboxylating) [Dethiosulfatarculus sandiegensis]|uniref:6-phosphogluconate dehydrogenase n=1 Tax=Dethiosulfatarculus sandiegensis TaxID=1429043 RepID=A0A0D2HJS1_9BACT|nr:decarboxylating 6-phosphogluconate dehydrogenase [Dethiosulfatarculus sandiegensis]KIX10903.1 6-phosphogluconate dehydrogenase [Dethiosulfatarculus sandiegensis]
MQMGMIGLGRMGFNMALRLIQKGHEIVAYNRSPEKINELAALGGQPATALTILKEKLRPPRAVWIMLPAGVVDHHIKELKKLLEPGDVLVEGGNSRYSDDLPRAKSLSEKGILYMDAGVSGGVWGLENGFCLMLGGPEKGFKLLEPLLKDLAPKGGYLHCGPTGSGHYSKMIHNGIEYGMMQAYAEGFELLKKGPYGDDLDLKALAGLWNQGSVVRSWLLELLELSLKQDPSLQKLRGYVEDSGEGRWTVEEAVKSSTPAPVLTLALMQRFRSRQENTFADRVLAALRNQFGGHAVKKN